MDIELNYKKFKAYLKNYVQREGIDDLIKWLDSSDVKVAPATTKYHLSEEGGLVQHSLDVFLRLIKLIKMEYPDKEVFDEEGNLVETVSTSPYSKETIAIVSLLHELSKVNYYTTYYKNVKNDETGNWEKIGYYKVREQSCRLFFGNRVENTIYLIEKFIKLTDIEKIALLYQMGGMAEYDNDYTKGLCFEAYKHSTLALFLHQADVQATCIDEVIPDERDLESVE